MTIVVPFEQVPFSGDIVKSVRFEEDYGFVEITFESGKIIAIHVEKKEKQK